MTSGMAQCIWQGNVRWFNNKYLRTVDGSAAPGGGGLPSTTIQYATANLNIWRSATGSAYTGEIPKGSEVAVTGTVRSGRAQIVHNGAIRWVTARYLSSSAPGGGNGGGGWRQPEPGLVEGPRSGQREHQTNRPLHLEQRSVDRKSVV